MPFDLTAPVRVGDSRVSLDTVIYEHLQGRDVAAIVDAYPSLKPEAVEYAIAFYHAKRAEVDAYLARREAEADEMQREVEARRAARRNNQGP